MELKCAIYNLSKLIFSCFQIFGIAHSLTTTPHALGLAASLTIKEFQEDGCCYLELRSTPRDTQHMTKKEYIDTLISTIK